jgi:hypothetical protein
MSYSDDDEEQFYVQTGPKEASLAYIIQVLGKTYEELK